MLMTRYSNDEKYMNSSISVLSLRGIDGDASY